MSPQISALMTVYNGEDFIEKTIDSILNQTFKDFELIIVNDASTDNTLNIIKKFNDSRIRIVELNNNLGVGGAIIEGLKYVNGEYIAKVDADDIYHPERFQKQLKFLENNQGIDVVDSYISYFPNSKSVSNTPRYSYLKNTVEKQINSIYKTEDIQKYLYWFVCITHSSVMFRRKILEIATYKNLKVGEDYDVFYKWNIAGIRMYKIPKVLAYIRVSNKSTSLRESSTIPQEVLKIKSNEISKIFKKHDKVYIWGTGGLAKKTLEFILKKGFVLEGFIDKEKYGTQFENKKTYSINELDFSYSIGILIAASPAKFEIANSLEKRGLKHLKDYLVIF